VWLQVTGAPFDSDAWAALGEQAQRDVIAAELALNAEAGLPTQLDLDGRAATRMRWNSPDALWRLLKPRGHILPARDNGKAPSLDDEALIALEDAGEPLAPLVRTYRDATRRAHTSGLDWLRHVAA